MADVAQRAGVSRALVSIVFRDVPGASHETRRRVREAADQLGYRPDPRARLLSRQRSRTVGVVFGLRSEFHGQLVEDLYRAVGSSGYDLALGVTAPSRDERLAVQSLLDYRCEALVLLGPTLPRAAIEELAAHVPVVVVARALRSRAVDVVRTDDVAGARLAVDHLADLGHTAITHVDGGRAPGAAERRRGYRAAMRDLGLAGQEHIVAGGLTEVTGELASEKLPAKTTAVTAFNDHSAAGLLLAARSRGVEVPGDMSVVGYDDSPIAALNSVALTTVAQDSAALAVSAVDLAVRRIDDGTDATPPTEVVIPPRLVVRRTTSPVP